MGNYFSSFNQQINNSINNSINNKTFDKFDRFNIYKNDSLYSSRIKYNLYTPSLPSIKE